MVGQIAELLPQLGAVVEHGLPYTLGIIAFELLAGLVVGLVVGFGGAWLMRRAALPSSGLYPLAVMCLALLAYGAAAGVHASGFAAIYIAALVLGNSELPHRTATRSFAEGVAWLADRLVAERQRGLAIILASHEPHLVSRVATRTIHVTPPVGAEADAGVADPVGGGTGA